MRSGFDWRYKGAPIIGELQGGWENLKTDDKKCPSGVGATRNLSIIFILNKLLEARKVTNFVNSRRTGCRTRLFVFNELRISLRDNETNETRETVGQENPETAQIFAEADDADEVYQTIHAAEKPSECWGEPMIQGLRPPT